MVSSSDDSKSCGLALRHHFPSSHPHHSHLHQCHHTQHHHCHSLHHWHSPGWQVHLRRAARPNQCSCSYDGNRSSSTLASSSVQPLPWCIRSTQPLFTCSQYNSILHVHVHMYVHPLYTTKRWGERTTIQLYAQQPCVYYTVPLTPLAS